MHEMPRISEIHHIFSKNTTSYVHFSLEKENLDYLCMNNPQEDRYALFFGTHFRKLITEYRQDPSIQCIECELGTNIIGGVSWDTGDLVEFNLSKTQANNILSVLKENPKILEKSIPFFN